MPLVSKYAGRVPPAIAKGALHMLPRNLNSVFWITPRGSTVRTEILGGITTFVTMAYIIVVNPAILKAAGFPEGPTTVATILVAVFGCLLMGLYANRPIAVAPYMGENAFLAFSLATMTFGPNNESITWQMRLGAVFLSGILFLIITLLRIRTWLANSISRSMKHSFAVGIGLFLAFIGLMQTRIIIKGKPEEVPVQIGDFRDPKVLLAVGGFAVMAILFARGIRGSILIGIVLTAIVGYALGHGEAPKGIVALPFVGEYDIRPIALKLDIQSLLHITFVPVLLTLFLISFLDTLGTLVGLSTTSELGDPHGRPMDLQRPMLVDALACVFAALVGTSTSGAYIESATGIRDGARTGLAAVVVALLFAVSLFFLPLVEPLQRLHYAYGPALILVGMLMLSAVVGIDFADPTEAAPAFVCILMMVFTYNIANGVTAGLILYPLIKLATFRVREIHPGSVALAILCLVYYVFGLPH